MPDLSTTKREFYAQPEIAQAYLEQRFGGASGAWVHTREMELVLSLLPPFQRALDLGCGTGRLTTELSACGMTIGVDTSLAMLYQAQQQINPPLAQGDAFALPFAGSSFDVVTALRVVFHFKQLDMLLREMTRVLAARGTIILDTYTWSPRAWLPLDQSHWGSQIYIHSPKQVILIAQRLGLVVAEWRTAFLFSPYLYRRLPLTLVRWLARLEARTPAHWRTRIFWKFVRAN